MTAVLDSSLDDLGLLRRCERRIVTFPHYMIHDFSFASTDSTLSSILPASSVSVFDEIGDGRSEDSVFSNTLIPTDRPTHDLTAFRNISVNRNPYQDGRRWVGQGDLTHCKSQVLIPKSSVGVSVKNSYTGNKVPEFGQQKQHCCHEGSHECITSASQRCCGKHNDGVDPLPNTSSESAPVIDNLILVDDFKCSSETKTKQRRTGAKSAPDDRQRAGSQVVVDTQTYTCDNIKQREQHRTTSLRQSSRSKSSLGSKDVLTPDSEIFLEKLDIILEKMSTKKGRQPSRSAEKMNRSVSRTDTLFNSLNKTCTAPSCKRSCNCPRRSAANSKLSLKSVVDDVKRTGMVRNRIAGTKSDKLKQDNLSVSRNRTKTRCQQLEVCEPAVSACKEHARKGILPQSAQEKFVCPHSNNRQRSKSVSASPRCHAHALTTSNTVPSRRATETNTGGATVHHSRKYTLQEVSGKFTKQQTEILKHIPDDITPEEIGALLKTVLSIADRRHCIKSCIHDDDTGDHRHKGTEDSPERLSKYQITSLSDISSPTSLSPKPSIHYSNKTADTSNDVAISKGNSSSESSEPKDNSQECLVTKDMCSQIRNKSMNYGYVNRTFTGTLPDQASANQPGDGVSKGHLASVPLGSVKNSDSESSARTFTFGSDTGGGSGLTKTQMFKKSAVVLPYDDNFSLQKRIAGIGGESAVSPFSGVQLTTPTCKNITDGKDINSCKDPEKQQQRVSSAPSTISSTEPRHIGWRFPLQTERTNHVTITDAFEGERHKTVPRAGHAKVKRSNSAYSDGLLYLKSTKASMKAAHYQIPQRSFESFAMMPTGSLREATGGDCRCQQHVGSFSSSKSPVSNPELPITRGRCSLLLPCPHKGIQHSHTFTCQTSSQSPEQSFTALNDTELDKTISELRSQLRDTFQPPVKTKRTTVNKLSAGLDLKISNATFILSNTTNAQERPHYFTKKESPIKGKCQGEVTDLDILSCSADTVMTNTSLSNRLLELDDEFLRREWRARNAKHPVENLQNFTAMPNPSEFQRDHCSSSSNAHLQGHGGILFGQEKTLQFCQQPDRIPVRESTPYKYHGKQQLPKYRTLSETHGEASKSSCVPPPSRLSSLISPITTSGSFSFRAHNVVTGLEKQAICLVSDRSCGLTKDRKQTEYISRINDSIFPAYFRPLDSRSDLKPHRSLEAPSNKETSSNLKPHFSMEPAINTKLLSNLKPASNFEPTCKLEYSLIDQMREKNSTDIDRESSQKQNIRAIKPTSRPTNLTQLKESTEALLGDVYRKYYSDLFAPSMECDKTQELVNVLELLQNFSPISQVDVNTRYPLTVDTREQLTPTETFGYTRNSPSISPENISPARTVIISSNQQGTVSTKTNNTTKDDNNCKVETTVTNSRVPNASMVAKVPARDTAKQIRASDNTAGQCKYLKPSAKEQTLSKCQCPGQIKVNAGRYEKTKSAPKEKDADIIDVTSPQKSDDGPDKQRNIPLQEGAKVHPQSVIVKTYHPMSAVPVDVKELNSEVTDGSNLYFETRKKLFPQQVSPLFETQRKHLAPVVFCSSSKRKAQNECPSHSAGDSQCCTVLCFNNSKSSATSAARKRLASNANNARMLAVHDSSLTPESCDEKATMGCVSKREQQEESTSDCNYTDSNNNNSITTPEQRNGGFLSVMSAMQPMYENESAAITRPSAKILGELAFQLERRILDYVFGMDGSKRRRFYGYTVNNICHMMHKECKNFCGKDDTIRKSELAFRLKSLLIGLRKVGYNIKEHGDFAQLMINKYGLLPCPPDSRTIEEFGLLNANYISGFITKLAVDEFETDNLQILLKSLQYLSKCDGRPLFVW